MRSREEFGREYPLFSHVEARARDFDCLICPDKTVDSIANFGCGSGIETLGLMHAFGAVEGIGIDIDSDGILQAVQTLEGLECAAVSVAHRAAYGEEYQEWWHELVPNFIKGLVFNRIPEGLARGVRETRVCFVEADITRPLCLAADHFDLAYCDHVLYHVFCDHGEHELQCAVSEMARVVAPGGCVVAVEPLSCSPECAQPLDFAEFFERCGLQCCQTQRDPIHHEGQARTYRYGRPPA
jgi:SAM-dependent methyltransferase